MRAAASINFNLGLMPTEFWNTIRGRGAFRNRHEYLAFIHDDRGNCLNRDELPKNELNQSIAG